MPEHTVGLYITPEGKFEYYDPNHAGGIQSFDSVDKLADAIQVSYKLEGPLKEGRMEVDFAAHKFYAKDEMVPAFESATPMAHSVDKQTNLSHAVMRND
jgi:hypothetical protein